MSVVLRRMLGRDWPLAWLFLAPCVAVIICLVVYPLAWAVLISLQTWGADATATWVGLANYHELLFGHDVGGVFRQSVVISVVYVTVAQVMNLVLGFAMALLLHENFPYRAVVRGVFFLPWAIPTLIAGFSWKWMYDGTSVGLLNMLAAGSGLNADLHQWLGNAHMALWSVIVAVVWSSTPFWSMLLLAGLQAIPAEQYAAADIDGADVFQRFWMVTLPGVTHLMVVAVTLSTIWTANSINMVYVLTGGGPANATMIFPLLAYQIGVVGAQRLGIGAAISLLLFPLFLVMMYLLTRRLLPEDL